MDDIDTACTQPSEQNWDHFCDHLLVSSAKIFFFPVATIVLALTEGMDVAVKCIYPGALSCLLLLKRFKMSPTWNISATGKGLLLSFYFFFFFAVQDQVSYPKRFSRAPPSWM